MKFLEFYQPARRFLVEMNVANEGEITAHLKDFVKRTVQDRHGVLPQPTQDTLVKRLVKAMKNDERGTMAEVQPVTEVPEDAPEWLRQAVEGGKEVVALQVREDTLQKLAHVIDWLLADPEPGALRAAPEAGLIDHLNAAADQFFARQQQAQPTSGGTSFRAGEEPGCEVVMTFRVFKPGDPPKMFQESDLAPNPNGKVVSFWVKVTSPEALDREGSKERMNHCVGSYANEVTSEQTTIYSLRDMSNHPHVTIEIRSGNLRQVKGKGNRPPVGKYAGYIKDFLNAVSAKVDNMGAGDLRGVGLFKRPHDGKLVEYDEIEEITVLEKFANGDTIRMHTEPNPSAGQGYYYGRQQSPFKFTYYYVEKGGTIPFQFEMVGEAQGGALRYLRMNREEVSRYPIYAKNLRTFIEHFQITPGDKSLELFGLYANGNRVGTFAEVADKVFTKNSVTGYGLLEPGGDDVVYFQGGNDKEPFLQLKWLPRKTPGKIEVVKPESKFAHEVPNVLLDYFNSVKLDYSRLDKDQKRKLWNYGILWSPHQQTYFSALGSKDEVFRTAKGVVMRVRDLLYVYGNDKTLLCSVGVEEKYPSIHIAGYGLKFFSDAGRKPALEILRLMSEQKPEFVFDSFNNDYVELGYTARNGRLISTKELESFRPPKGMTMTTTVWPDTTVYTFTDGADKFQVKVNKDGVVTGVTLDDEVQDTLRQSLKKGEKFVSPANNARRLLALKALKLKIAKTDLLKCGFWLQGDKIVPIKDGSDLAAYRAGRMPIDGTFSIKVYSQDKPQPDVRIEAKRPEYSFGDTVAKVEFKDDELKIGMYKHIPDHVNRAQVRKLVLRFMEFYHDVLEPMDSDDIIEFR